MNRLLKPAVAVVCFGVIFFFQSSANAQSQRAPGEALKPGIYLQDGSRMNEYKKTYEIKDVDNPSEKTLARIDATKYWKLFKVNERTEVVDNITGVTLILYSREEMKDTFNSNDYLFVLPPDYSEQQPKYVDLTKPQPKLEK